MADPKSFRRIHFPLNLSSGQLHSPIQSKPIISNKSYTQILSKFVFFALFLVAIPLFPSQAPDYVNHTIVSKFWELLHLLFFGIAVSYGLFSRRNVDTDYEIQSNLDDYSYLNASQIFHTSSIFEDGYETFTRSDEKVEFQTWNSKQYECESVDLVHGGNSEERNEQSRVGSLNREYDSEKLGGYDENYGVQTWNSQYFQGESMVVIAQSNSLDDGYNHPGLKLCPKPLGLPIRSLRPRVQNPDSCESSNGSESRSKVIRSRFKNPESSESSNGSESGSQSMRSRARRHTHNSSIHGSESGSKAKESRLRKKDRPDPANGSEAGSKVRNEDSPELSNGSESSSSVNSCKSSGRSGHGKFSETNVEYSEENFNERVGLPSPNIPWRSRSGRMEMRETLGTSSRASHFRPLSVDETQFESLKSRSFQSTISFSSSNHSRSNSVSSDSPDMEMGEFGKEKGSRWSYPPPASPTPPPPQNGKASMNSSRSWQHSNESLLEKDMPRSFKDDSNNSSLRGGNEAFWGKEMRSGSLRWDPKAPTDVKASSRGRSVRTIRSSSKYTSEAFGERGENGDDKEVRNHRTEVLYKKKNELTNRRFGDMKNSVVSNPTFLESQNEERKVEPEHFKVESAEEDLDSEDEDLKVSSDEEVGPETVSEEGRDHNEVDKKAGEFIAKFREQIRLQKQETSSHKSKGRMSSGNYFR